MASKSVKYRVGTFMRNAVLADSELSQTITDLGITRYTDPEMVADMVMKELPVDIVKDLAADVLRRDPSLADGLGILLDQNGI